MNDLAEKQKVKGFRSDINALRAYAVIAVVLYHFYPSYLLGGFAGVDVFFVISGYLMTSIIFSGIENNKFSLMKFYADRVNRILPPLFFVCLTLMLYGYFFLTPMDYRELGVHIASSLSFLSNFVYWFQTDYFDASSLEKWLLHTWSLSVEWQFYIIFPIFILFLFRFFCLKVIKSIFLILTFGLLMVSIFFSNFSPDSAYYLLHTRAWEMLAGSLAFLYPLKFSLIKSRALVVIGFLMILASYIVVHDSSNWPGYLALIPVLGAVLIILTSSGFTFPKPVSFFNHIGLSSYSVYLWHWPILVAINYYSLSGIYLVLGFFLSFFIGYLSFKYIERGSLFSYKVLNVKFLPALCSVLLVFFGVFLYFSGGLPHRFNTDEDHKNVFEGLVMPFRSNGYCFNSFNKADGLVDYRAGTECYLGHKEPSINDSPKKKKVLLFGDSYAGHNEPFFDEIFKNYGAAFQSVTTNWCFPSFKDEFTGPLQHDSYKQCLLNREFLKSNYKGYDSIIFAASWGKVLEKGYLDSVLKLINDVSYSGVDVYLVAAPFNYSQNPLKGFYRSYYFGFNFDPSDFGNKDFYFSRANEILFDYSNSVDNVYFITRKAMFDDEKTFTERGLEVPFSLDGGHISVLGAKAAAKVFLKDANNAPIINQIFYGK